jgi:hypothetical protein
MTATASSSPSQISEPAASHLGWLPVALTGALATLLGLGAVWLSWRRGWTLYYGDAEAHLNIARRILDSRTPGYGQIGTGWLPLLHLVLLPFAARDELWRSGIAGAIPPAVCFVLGVTFLFAAVRRVFMSTTAGAVAAALYALNPNALYLQSTPMTEPVFFAEFAALLYFTVRFGRTQTVGSAVGAGIATFAATLTRYEGWFLIPFATAYFLFAAHRRRFRTALVFGAIASLGPLLWLGYNGLVFDNVWEFYSGSASAKAIQGGRPYPGIGDWKTALIYFGWVVRACAGAPLFFVAGAGVVAAVWKRAFWPLVLLALPGIFYVWSMHSSGSTPIFLPYLWPHSYYNTRYGLALLPLLAFGGAAVVALLSSATSRAWPGGVAAVGVVVLAILPWVLIPRPETWITWKEAEANSTARRAWTKAASNFLAVRYHAGDGIFTFATEPFAAFREAGIPLRDTLTGDNGPAFEATQLRPDLFLWEQWALVTGGDPEQTTINRARRRGPNYNLATRIVVKGAPVVEIYERSTVPADWLHPIHEDPVP